MNTSGGANKKMTRREAFIVLGLENNRYASDSEIKAAYFRLARQYHPDKVGPGIALEDAEEKMRLINKANKIAMDRSAEDEDEVWANEDHDDVDFMDPRGMEETEDGDLESWTKEEKYFYNLFPEQKKKKFEEKRRERAAREERLRREEEERLAKIKAEEKAKRREEAKRQAELKRQEERRRMEEMVRIKLKLIGDVLIILKSGKAQASSEAQSLESLLAQSAEVNKPFLPNVYPGGKYPLHVAVEFKNFESVKLLCDHAVNINCVDNNRDTPLHIALKKGLSEITDFLVSRWADTKLKNKAGITAGEMIYKLEQEKIALAKIEEERRIAAEKARDEKRKAEEKEREERRKEAERLQRITENTKNIINSKGNVNSFDKALQGMTFNDISEVLIEGKPLIHHLVILNNSSFLDILLKKGVETTLPVDDKTGNTALHLALYNDNFECACLLIQNGASLDTLNNSKETPFEHAYSNADTQKDFSSFCKKYASVQIESLTQKGIATSATDESKIEICICDSVKLKDMKSLPKLEKSKGYIFDFSRGFRKDGVPFEKPVVLLSKGGKMITVSLNNVVKYVEDTEGRGVVRKASAPDIKVKKAKKKAIVLDANKVAQSRAIINSLSSLGYHPDSCIIAWNKFSDKFSEDVNQAAEWLLLQSESDIAAERESNSEFLECYHETIAKIEADEKVQKLAMEERERIEKEKAEKLELARQAKSKKENELRESILKREREERERGTALVKEKEREAALIKEKEEIERIRKQALIKQEEERLSKLKEAEKIAKSKREEQERLAKLRLEEEEMEKKRKLEEERDRKKKLEFKLDIRSEAMNRILEEERLAKLKEEEMELEDIRKEALNRLREEQRLAKLKKKSEKIKAAHPPSISPVIEKNPPVDRRSAFITKVSKLISNSPDNKVTIQELGIAMSPQDRLDDSYLGDQIKSCSEFILIRDSDGRLCVALASSTSPTIPIDCSKSTRDEVLSPSFTNPKESTKSKKDVFIKIIKNLILESKDKKISTKDLGVAIEKTYRLSESTSLKDQISSCSEFSVSRCNEGGGYIVTLKEDSKVSPPLVKGKSKLNAKLTEEELESEMIRKEAMERLKNEPKEKPSPKLLSEEEIELEAIRKEAMERLTKDELKGKEAPPLPKLSEDELELEIIRKEAMERLKEEQLKSKKKDSKKVEAKKDEKVNSLKRISPNPDLKVDATKEEKINSSMKTIPIPDTKIEAKKDEKVNSLIKISPTNEKKSNFISKITKLIFTSSKKKLTIPEIARNLNSEDRLDSSYLGDQIKSCNEFTLKEGKDGQLFVHLSSISQPVKDEAPEKGKASVKENVKETKNQKLFDFVSKLILSSPDKQYSIQKVGVKANELGKGIIQSGSSLSSQLKAFSEFSVVIAQKPHDSYVCFSSNYKITNPPPLPLNPTVSNVLEENGKKEVKKRKKLSKKEAKIEEGKASLDDATLSKIINSIKVDENLSIKNDDEIIKLVRIALEKMNSKDSPASSLNNVNDNESKTSHNSKSTGVLNSSLRISKSSPPFKNGELASKSPSSSGSEPEKEINVERMRKEELARLKNLEVEMQKIANENERKIEEDRRLRNLELEKEKNQREKEIKQKEEEAIEQAKKLHQKAQAERERQRIEEEERVRLEQLKVFEDRERKRRKEQERVRVEQLKVYEERERKRRDSEDRKRKESEAFAKANKERERMWAADAERARRAKMEERARLETRERAAPEKEREPRLWRISVMEEKEKQYRQPDRERRYFDMERERNYEIEREREKRNFEIEKEKAMLMERERLWRLEQERIEKEKINNSNSYLFVPSSISGLDISQVDPSVEEKLRERQAKRMAIQAQVFATDSLTNNVVIPTFSATTGLYASGKSFFMDEKAFEAPSSTNASNIPLIPRARTISETSIEEKLRERQAKRMAIQAQAFISDSSSANDGSNPISIAATGLSASAKSFSIDNKISEIPVFIPSGSLVDASVEERIRERQMKKEMSLKAQTFNNINSYIDLSIPRGISHLDTYSSIERDYEREAIEYQPKRY